MSKEHTIEGTKVLEKHGSFLKYMREHPQFTYGCAHTQYTPFHFINDNIADYLGLRDEPYTKEEENMQYSNYENFKYTKEEENMQYSNYENFKADFTADIKNRLEQQGIDVEISMHNVKKVNGGYESVVVTPAGQNVGVNVPIELFNNMMEKGRTYDLVVDMAVEFAKGGIAELPTVDVQLLYDYDKMKEKLVIEIVSAEANKDMLEAVPHYDIEDMAIVYHFSLNTGANDMKSVLITNSLLKNLGVTPEQLHADAMEYAPKNKPAEVKGMVEMIIELGRPEFAEMMGLPRVTPDNDVALIATVSDKIHGAAVIAYPGFLEQMADKLGQDFFILPSSIHEVIFCRDSGEDDAKEFLNMVQEINATVLESQDKLTDSVYHYDCKDKVFEHVEKFYARKAEETAEEKVELE